MGEAWVSCCTGCSCCLGEGCCCGLGNWARIWVGVPTKLLGDGNLAEATLMADVQTPGSQKIWRSLSPGPLTHTIFAYKEELLMTTKQPRVARCICVTSHQYRKSHYLLRERRENATFKTVPSPSFMCTPKRCMLYL